MEWALGFDSEATSVIDQATYNVISEMGVQPVTPAGDITLDSSSEAEPPWASPPPHRVATAIGQSVSFDASASKDPDATITDYKWDLDNSGTFATDTGATPTLSHVFSQPGTYKVILKTTDSRGAVDTTARTVTVANSATANMKASMNPVGVGQTDTFNGAGSTDVGGTITDYKWDLNGDGTYETDTGSTPTVTRQICDRRHHHFIGLQVTDSKGATATAEIEYPRDRAGCQPLCRLCDLGAGPAALLLQAR